MAARAQYGPRPRPPPQQPQLQPKPATVAAPVPKPPGPPFPVAVPISILFVVVVFLAILLNYFSATYGILEFLPVLLIVLALVLVALSLHTANIYHDKHRSDDKKMARLATLGTVGIMIGGTVAGAVTFALLEPYNDWSFSAELNCEGSCIADLPVPMVSSNASVTFFNETQVKTTGQGYVEVIREFVVGGPYPALRVHWSGKFVVAVKNGKDYRDLPVGKRGMYDDHDKEFLVQGQQIPSDANATVKVIFDHNHKSQAPRSDHWSIKGPIVQGENWFSAKKN